MIAANTYAHYTIYYGIKTEFSDISSYMFVSFRPIRKLQDYSQTTSIMASNIMKENGHEPTPKLRIDDVKIIVVGEPKCGKSSFIKVFHEKNRSLEDDIYPAECARVYPCRYEVRGPVPTNVKIYEIIGGSEELAKALTGFHTETNGFVLMYAIDDPSSFEQVKEKWLPALNQEYMWKRNEPGILVGNKRDLRNDPQVIQRLANNNQVPVTEQDGKNFVRDRDQISKYFDCSSIEAINVDAAFHYIITGGLADLIVDEGLNAPPV